VASGANGNLLIVGIIQDKLDDGLAKPILPEAFVPYTLGLRMGTQILVRSEVSPLTLLHAVSAKVNSIDHDQQTNSGTEDLEHWIQDQPEWAAAACLPGCLAHLPLWHWPCPPSAFTASSPTPSCSEPMNSASAWRSERSERTCLPSSFAQRLPASAAAF
jgi:hypothetical protein